MPKTAAKELVDGREASYGRSWLWVPQMLAALPLPVRVKLYSSMYFHAWYMILSKLCRLAVDPFHLDSWQDIQGYAQLVIDVLEPISKKVQEDDHAAPG